MITEINEQYLTIKQAQAYLKCSDVFIYLKRKEGVFETVKPGVRKVLITKESIDRYLKSTIKS